MATFTNQATLTYTGGSISSNIVTGELREAVSASKTAAGETYRPGETVTYALSLLNAGGTAATGITVRDDLGAGGSAFAPLSYVPGSLLYFVNGELQPAPTVTAGPPLVIGDITIPAGGNALLVYRALVGETASPAPGGSITNTAIITGGTGMTPVVVSETITVEEGASLSITKELDPPVVSDGDRLTYTLTVRNFGNQDAVATDNLTITDTLDPALTDITVTLNGVTLTEGTDYTYNEATGAFSTTESLITVPAATFTQDPVTGAWTTVPGTAVLVITGTV